MLQKLFGKKRSVVYSWSISYLLIILIPLIATAYVYDVARNIIEEEVNNANALMIEKMRDEIDGVLENIQKFSIEISLNQRIKDVASLKSIESGVQSYVLYEAGRQLGSYKTFTNSLKRYYIYFNKLKMVIAANAAYTEEDYFNFHLSGDGYTIEQWLETVGKVYTGNYLVMPYHEEDLGKTKGVAFIRSIPLPAFGEPLANVVFILNFDEILKRSSDGYSDEIKLLVVNSDGNVLAGEAAGYSPDEIDYGGMNNTQGSIYQTLDNRKAVITYTSSRVTGWKYITITPESVYSRKVIRIRNIMLGGLAACLVLAALISYFSIKRNYDPLREIVSYYKGVVNDENERNEYGFIKQVLNETIKQKENIQLKLNKQNRVMKSSFIESLLKGKTAMVPMHELMTAYNIRFDQKYFVVISIYIQNMDEGFWNGDFESGIQEYSLARFVIINVMEELLNKEMHGYMTEVDDMLACLVNTNYGTCYREKLLGIINEARSFIEENYRLTLLFAIGSPHESIEGIHDAYAESVDAMEYAKVMGMRTPVFYDEIKTAGNYYYYPVEKEYQLINCIKSMNYQGAVDIIEDIFKNNLVSNTPSLEVTRCLMFDLIGTILKTINVLDKKELSFFEGMDVVNVLMNCESLMEMKQKINEIIRKTCDYVEKTSYVKDYSIRDMVIDIIEKNYSDVNLGIASIAEKIGKYPYYVSKVFKDQTGEGILEYINRVRIQRAKELMQKETGLTQEEISERVGYSSVRTFQRAFKRLEGTTPGKLNS